MFQRDLDGWSVSWESAGAYRHWCVQARADHRHRVVVVLKNPGSLSGDGARLRRDTTLRILRGVGAETGTDWLIVNLFDYAAANPRALHAQWHRRDAAALVFARLDLRRDRFLMLAHGDFDGPCAPDYRRRIAVVRKHFGALHEIALPLTKAGNGVHPLNWQRMRLKARVVDAIRAATTRS